jgi:hypothetical protein
MPVRHANQLYRRRWLRLLAWIGGALVLLAHIYTLDTHPAIQNLFDANLRDALYHSGMLTLFTLAYRGSLSSGPTSRSRRRGKRVKVAMPAKPMLSPADASALWVCCGWGAMCELLQLAIPAREFSFIELGLNTLVPAIVVALYSQISARRQR